MTLPPAAGGGGRYVLIVGNIGSGKSSLAGELALRLRLQHYPEPFELNPFLGAFYAQPETYALRSQLSFLVAHHRQHLALHAGGAWAVKDGSLFDSAEVVTRRMSEAGLLTAAEWDLYQAVYASLRPSCTLPALTLWLQAREEVLLARIRKRARSFEQGISIEFLRAMQHGYARWAGQWTRSPLLAIDTTSLDVETVAQQAIPALSRLIFA